MSEYVKRIRTRSTPIGDQIIERVREAIDRNLGKFPMLSDSDIVAQNGAFGYRKISGNGTLYLFHPSVFNDMVGEKFGERAAVSQLRKSGFLKTNKEGGQFLVRMPGKGNLRKRFYAVKDTIRFEKA